MLTPFLIVTALFALSPQQAWAQRITSIVDGDTIIVAGVVSVLLIGVDTSETVDPRRPVQAFRKEASEFAKAMALGKVAKLEFDRFNRTPAYA